MNCPNCQSDRVIRSGLNASGTQRYQCLDCSRRFTPKPKKSGKKANGKAKTGAERSRLYRQNQKLKEQNNGK